MAIHMKTSSIIWAIAIVGTVFGLGAYTLGGQGRSEVAVLRIERAASCLAFSPDGKHLVVGTDNGTKEDLTFWTGELTVWEVSSRKKIHDIKLPQWAREVRFSQNGDLIAVGIGCHQDHYNVVPKGFVAKTGEAILYSFPSMKEVGRIESGLVVNSVSLSPDGKWLATSSRCDTNYRFARLPAKIDVWEVATGELKYSLPGLVHHKCQASFSPDGKLLAVGDRLPPNDPQGRLGYEMRFFNADTGKLSSSFLMVGQSALQEFNFSPSSASVYVNAGVIACWDIEKGVETTTPLGKIPHALNRKLAVASKGTGLVIANDFIKGFPDKPAKVFVTDSDSDTIHDQWTWSGKIRNVRCVAISPDMRTVAIGQSGVFLFDVKAK